MGQMTYCIMTSLKYFLKIFIRVLLIYNVVKASFFVFWSNWRGGKSGAECPETQEQQIFLEGSSQLSRALTGDCRAE